MKKTNKRLLAAGVFSVLSESFSLVSVLHPAAETT